MKIIVDKEAREKINYICDVALKSEGLNTLNTVLQVLQCMQVAPEAVPEVVPEAVQEEAKDPR